MQDGRTTSYRVRIAGQEILVPDLEHLRKLARAGQIGASAQVKAPGKDNWVPLSQVLGAGGKRDPWSAWESADQVDPESIWRQYTEPPDADEEPTPHVLPLRTVKRGQEPEPPPVAVDELDDVRDYEPFEPPDPEPEPVSTDAGLRPAGKVLVFPSRPGSPRPKTEGAHALARVEALPVRPPRARPPEPEPPRTQWWRMAAVVSLGAVATALMVLYVAGTASVQYPARPGAIPKSSAMSQPDATGVASGPPISDTPTAGPAQPSAAPVSVSPTRSANEVYEALEEELRRQLSSDIQDVSPSRPLEDALLIELRRMRLDVTRVVAPVVVWAGRRSDVPQSARVHIELRSSTVEFDRDIGAVGLVVGKYLQRYSLDVPAVEVVFEGLGDTPLTLSIEPERSRQFFLQRKSLLQFLTNR